jgi:pimeloyl-ACP methyl ester carboxylesterase
VISRIQTKSGPVEFCDKSSGPVILYMHGILSGCDLALKIEAYLASSGFRIVIPHRPGYLGTPAKLVGYASASECADQAAAVLDHLGIERAAVIGTSAGGPPAVAFARNYAHRTSALILQCAQTHRWDSSDWLPISHQWTLPLLKTDWMRWLACCYYFAMCRFGPGGVKAAVAGWTGPRFAEMKDDAEVNQIAAEFISTMTGLRGYYNDMTVFLKDDVLGDKSVTCPTLVVHDPLDATVPIQHAKFAVKHMPNSELLELSLGGHYVWAGCEIDLMHKRRHEFLMKHADIKTQ